MPTPNQPHTSVVHGDTVHREWSRFKYPQSLIKYGIFLGILLFFSYSVHYLDIPLERIFGMFGRLGNLLADRYYPPDMEYIWDIDYLEAIIETIQMA